MSARLVGEGKLSEISADHIEFDFDIVECLAIVDCDVVSNHFGKYDGITEVSLDGDWLLSGLSILFGFLAFSVESDVFVFDFYMIVCILLENLLLILALKSSTTCSWVSSLTCSGVSPLKLCLLRPFSFFWTVAMWLIIY